jgi:microcompartment protein CcmK/EutM
MKVASVVGTVVSTINHPLFDNRRLLICEYEDADGAAVGGYTIAVDLVDAGVGEVVLLIDEGNSARQLLDVETGPIRAVVVGIVDEWHDDG